nr:unnamed protein product [Callosobruchus analis]
MYDKTVYRKQDLALANLELAFLEQGAAVSAAIYPIKNGYVRMRRSSVTSPSVMLIHDRLVARGVCCCPCGNDKRIEETEKKENSGEKVVE